MSYATIKIIDNKKPCSICKRMLPVSEFSKSDNPKSKYGSWCLDHDHKTGRARGVLCRHCNNALGLFHENIESLRKAIEYLEK